MVTKTLPLAVSCSPKWGTTWGSTLLLLLDRVVTNPAFFGQEYWTLGRRSGYGERTAKEVQQVRSE